MNESADIWFDRARLKTKLTYWRSLAILLSALLVGFLLWQQGLVGSAEISGNSVIARVNISGIIADDAARDRLLKKIEKNRSIKAVILRMDSPGGTTVGGEELYENFKKIAKTKPVISVMRTVCASACYMAALSSNYLVARETSITGSIGVLMQSVEVSELADSLGIHPITISGGEFKDAPSMFKKPTERELDAVRPLVNDTHDYFISLVSTHRGLSGEALKKATDGRVFTGRQALNMKLIDAIGGEDEALAWLKKTKNISGTIRDFSSEDELSGLKKWLESSAFIRFLTQATVPLDGLVSIWHFGAH